LGVWINPKCQEKASIGRCKKVVGCITSILKMKRLSVNQIVYINNIVLLPKLEYILANIIIDKKRCDSIHQPFIRLLKQKAELLIICVNVIILYKEIFRVMSLWQKHAEYYISELFI